MSSNDIKHCKHTCKTCDKVITYSPADCPSDYLSRTWHISENPYGDEIRYGHTSTPDRIYRYGEPILFCRSCYLTIKENSQSSDIASKDDAIKIMKTNKRLCAWWEK
jgi:hypothetical protein